LNSVRQHRGSEQQREVTEERHASTKAEERPGHAYVFILVLTPRTAAYMRVPVKLIHDTDAQAIAVFLVFEIRPGLQSKRHGTPLQGFYIILKSYRRYNNNIIILHF
jgi:hypothetical protein